MARPIRTRPAAADVSVDTVAETLAPDLEASAESIRDLLELIRLLDERGFLRFSADLLREEDRVVEVLSERFRPEDLRRAVANLEVLVRTFRDIDPTTLGAIARAVPAALVESHRAESDAPMGLFEMLSVLREPEVNRGVRMVLGFLRGVGRTVPG
jgi:uncharacterized protein YjgD (DUF1641 family)